MKRFALLITKQKTKTTQKYSQPARLTNNYTQGKLTTR